MTSEKSVLRDGEKAVKEALARILSRQKGGVARIKSTKILEELGIPQPRPHLISLIRFHVENMGAIDVNGSEWIYAGTETKKFKYARHIFVRRDLVSDANKYPIPTKFSGENGAPEE